MLKPEGAEIQQLNFYRGPETHKRRNPQTRKYGNLGHARHPTTTNARNLKMFIRAFRATGIPRSGVSDGSIDSLSSETAETALGGGGGGTPLPESVPAGGRTETLSLCGPETVGRTGGAKMRTGGRWHARTDGRADGKIGDDCFL